MTVEVVLPLPLDQAYTYRVPAAWEGKVPAGTRVLVPFGARRLTGVVVGEGKPPGALDFDLKDLLEVLDERPALTSELLRLTRWVADYYLCGWGEAFKAALPAGTDVADGRDPRVTPRREAHLRLAPAFRSGGAVRDLKAQLRGARQRAVRDAVDSESYAQHEAAIAEVVERDGLPCHLPRPATRQWGDEWAKPDRRCRGGDGAERHPCIGQRDGGLVLEVVPQEEAVPLCFLGGYGEVDEYVDVAERSDWRQVDGVAHHPEHYGLIRRSEVPRRRRCVPPEPAFRDTRVR